MNRMVHITKAIETHFPPSFTRCLASIIDIFFPFTFSCSKLLSPHAPSPHLLLQGPKL